MLSLILNRDFQHPADGWYQIEARGEHPHGGSGLIQVIDSVSAASIVERFNADAVAGRLRHGHEMLIDHEHFSDQPDQETRAYGWLQELQNRNDGIYGRIRWTATGKTSVDGGDYRFFSTEYNPSNLQPVQNAERGVRNEEAKCVRPLRLAGLTLTNMNNNRGQKPITNRDDSGTHSSRRALQNTSSCSHMNSDGTFKGGFDGCVLHMQFCEGHSEASAKAICGRIAQRVMNRISLPSQKIPADQTCPDCQVPLENDDDGSGVLVCPNCKTHFADSQVEARPGETAEPSHAEASEDRKTKTKNRKANMNKLAKVLGLADEAGEEAILAAVTRLQNRASELEPLSAENTALKNRVQQMEAEQVAGLFAERKITDDKIINRLKPVLTGLANREERLAFLNDCGFVAHEVTSAGSAKPPVRVLNRGSVPQTTAETVTDEKSVADKITNRANELRGAAPARTFNDCWNQAQREMARKG
jgi:uncharacterized Zn finger protein (UPF0148 family)